jgi:hypothetical protein
MSMTTYTEKQRLEMLAGAIAAHLAGKRVQYLHETLALWYYADEPTFREARYWRAAPEPATRPWNEHDVPPVCWIRDKNTHYPERVVACIFRDCIMLHDTASIGYSTLATGYEWSADRREWKSCTVSEP